jgi:hypothetical protein
MFDSSPTRPVHPRLQKFNTSSVRCKQPIDVRRDVRLLRNSAASAYCTSVRTADVEMVDSARRLNATMLAGGSKLRLYPVLLAAGKSIGWSHENHDCLLA